MDFDHDDNWQGSLLDILRRWAATLAIIFILLLVSTFPLTLAGLSEIRPSFLLIAIYYWAVMRPSTLPPVGVFFVGLAFDLMADYPLGLTALTLVLVQWMTASQRKFLLGQSFVVMWMGFVLVAAGAAALQWLFFSLFNFRLLAPQPCIASAVLTAAFFPLTVPILASFSSRLNGRENNPRDR